MLESEEPQAFLRDWFIPWYTNWAVWSLTVTAVVLSRVMATPSLAFGPMPLSETEAVQALADSRTVIGPVAIVALFGLIIWILNIRPLKKRKGRKAPKYLLKQFGDEFRSFSLNAASLSAITCYYARNNTLLISALGCWALWAVLHWFWLQENGKSPLDA